MRKTALAAGGAALAIAVAGCGGSGGNGGGSGDTISGQAQPMFGSAQELVQAAKSETTKAKTVKVNMNMNMGSQKMTSHGKMRFAGEDTAMAMTMDAAGTKMQIRLVDKVMYLKAPKLTQKMQLSKPWLKIARDGNNPLSKMLGPMLDKMSQNSDPTKLLQQIKKAGEITKKQRGQLDGKSVSHYWVKLDFLKMAKVKYQSGPMAELIQKQAEKFKGVKVPMQLWLNAKSLPMKVTMDLSEMTKRMAQSAGKSSSSMGGGKVTVRYTDWGSPVEIKAPPQSKVGQPKMPTMPN